LIGVLEESVKLELARAERLRQSILKRAFEGKLVAQDPNDEPASALLERVRAERAKVVNATAKRKSRRPRTVAME
jgi:type I restriction enzyme S subunit